MDVKSHGLLATRSPLTCCCTTVLRKWAEACELVLWRASLLLWRCANRCLGVSCGLERKVVCFRLQRCGERTVAAYVKVRVQAFRKRLRGDFAYIGKVLDIGMWASLFVVRRRSASDQGLSPWRVSSHQNCRYSVHSSSATWLAVYAFGLDTQCTKARTP